jgi:hypothetical protein
MSASEPYNRRSASGSALGYQYQFDRALLDLVERHLSREHSSFFLESIDDYEVVTSDGRVTVQVKHHLGNGPDLTDTSRDLWRAMTIWIENLGKLEPDEGAVFTLVSTSIAPSGSAAASLRDEGRDEGAALDLLLNAAEQSENKDTVVSRRQFAELSPPDRVRLVGAVRVRDAELGAVALKDQLAARLEVFIWPEYRDDFAEALAGWWHTRCVAMLAGHEDAITTDDLSVKLQTLRDGYRPPSLPFDWGLAPTDEERLSYETRLFMKQLSWVAASDAMLRRAIDDYHRSYHNKSRWLRVGVIGREELDDYERRLVDAWGRAREWMMLRLGSTTDTDALAAAGLELWRTVSSSSEVALREFHDQALVHGSYHELADGGEDRRPRVGWHPSFEERLRDLLEPVGR